MLGGEPGQIYTQATQPFAAGTLHEIEIAGVINDPAGIGILIINPNLPAKNAMDRVMVYRVLDFFAPVWLVFYLRGFPRTVEPCDRQAGGKSSKSSGAIAVRGSASPKCR